MKLPKESVAAVAGDALLQQGPEGRWQVFFVVDLLQLQRLLPLTDDPRQLMRESDLLDSNAPAYFDEPYLLLTLCDAVYPTEAAALQALENSTLTRRIENIIRPARAFTAQNSRLVRAAGPR